MTGRSQRVQEELDSVDVPGESGKTSRATGSRGTQQGPLARGLARPPAAADSASTTRLYRAGPTSSASGRRLLAASFAARSVQSRVVRSRRSSRSSRTSDPSRAGRRPNLSARWATAARWIGGLVGFGRFTHQRRLGPDMVKPDSSPFLRVTLAASASPARRHGRRPRNGGSRDRGPSPCLPPPKRCLRRRGSAR